MRAEQTFKAASHRRASAWATRSIDAQPRRRAGARGTAPPTVVASPSAFVRCLLLGVAVGGHAAGFGVACGHRGSAAPTATAQTAFAAPSAADLPLPDSIAGTFTVRQKLVAKSPHGGGSFEAVLAKAAGTLTVVGLMPYGARAFVLEQRGGDVKFTNHMPREPPFPPAWMLLDIYRVFGSWLGQPMVDGQRQGVNHGEQVQETWRNSQLVARTFVRAAAGDAAGMISISYRGQVSPGLAEHVTLRNARFGYDLTIHTLPSLPPP